MKKTCYHGVLGSQKALMLRIQHGRHYTKYCCFKAKTAKMFQKTPQTRYKENWGIYSVSFDVAEPDKNLHFFIKGQGHQKNNMASIG